MMGLLPSVGEKIHCSEQRVFEMPSTDMYLHLLFSQTERFLPRHRKIFHIFSNLVKYFETPTFLI
jgi:hypothetical protein